MGGLNLVKPKVLGSANYQINACPNAARKFGADVVFPKLRHKSLIKRLLQQIVTKVDVQIFLSAASDSRASFDRATRSKRKRRDSRQRDRLRFSAALHIDIQRQEAVEIIKDQFIVQLVKRSKLAAVYRSEEHTSELQSHFN